MARLNALKLDYLAINCASSFRGHEAILNHTDNKPEILTCPHEEIAVAMAHGYAGVRQTDGHDLPRHGRFAARDDSVYNACTTGFRSTR
jgi:hypothetical protein